MPAYTIARRGALGALALVPLARRARAQSLDRIVFQTNWRAQAEHGGFYQAVASGIYRRHGIDCELRQGGPQVNGAALLLAGRVDMFMSNGFQALNYVRQNLPFLTVFATMQKDPQVLMAHAGAGNDSFEALAGKPIMVGNDGRVTYWPFLKARFGYTDAQLRPYTFNLAPFLADKAAVQQGFLTSEPFSAEKAGAKVVAHLIADAGYTNYQQTVDVAASTVANRREVVQRWVDASIEGWAHYMAGRDAAAANALIRRDNPEMTEELIAYAVKAMNDRGIIKSGDADRLGIGAMTAGRWRDFYDTLVRVGVHQPGLDVTKAYSLDFVNRGVGL